MLASPKRRDKIVGRSLESMVSSLLEIVVIICLIMIVLCFTRKHVLMPGAGLVPLPDKYEKYAEIALAVIVAVVLFVGLVGIPVAVSMGCVR